MRVAKLFYVLLAPISLVCFAGALVTDLAYWRTAQMMWADFSAWLVTAGVLIGFLAAIFGLIGLLGDRLLRADALTWLYAIGNAAALILATLNMFVHTRDAWTSVVPWGLALSAGVVLILALTGWIGCSRLYLAGARIAK